jgi:hypothetical protein
MLSVTTTADWIVGGVALVIGLVVIVGIVWLLWRLVTWPARARGRRGTGGLGSDYETMIRQQPRTRPAMGERPMPFPPPGGWQQSPTAPAVSRVVLPPPGYRTREPDTPEPEPTLLAAGAATNDSPPKPGLFDRGLRVFLPWVIQPLAWLGLCFIVFVPFNLGWTGWGVALVFAVGLGVWTRRRYTQRILWRGSAGREFVVWLRWGQQDAAAEPPVVVTPVAGDAPASTETHAAGIN